MKKQELFYYNAYGEKLSRNFRCNSNIVSEIELPRPTRNRKLKEYCAMQSPRLPENLKSGDIVDLALGHPIILKQCVVLSSNGNPAPRAACLGNEIVSVFRYKNKRVWVMDVHVCLLSELGKKR